MIQPKLVPLTDSVQKQIKDWLHQPAAQAFLDAISAEQDYETIKAEAEAALADAQPARNYSAHECWTKARRFRTFLEVMKQVSNPSFVFSNVEVTILRAQ